MERLGRSIPKLAKPCVTEEQVARAAWAVAVGKKIAARTSPMSLVRTRLIIGVEDEVWQRQLFTLQHQIIRKLQDTIGASIVTELEFRVVPRRIPPQREEAGFGFVLQSNDEADLIRDPMLRSLYKASRKRANT